MAVNYPYYPQQQPQPPMNPYASMPRLPYTEQPQIGIKGRPVSSIEEVRATSIDFDGSIFFFPDLANKKIYTKQINIDGTSTLNVYELRTVPLVESTTPTIDSAQFVTREEFESALSKLNEKIAPRPVEAAMTQQVNEQYKQNF